MITFEELKRLNKKYEICLSLVKMPLNEDGKDLIDGEFKPSLPFICLKLLKLFMKCLLFALSQFCVLIILIEPNFYIKVLFHKFEYFACWHAHVFIIFIFMQVVDFLLDF